MNEIAKHRTAEKFYEAIHKEKLTNKQVSEITGINYYYVGKAKNLHECHKAPEYVMHYLKEWVNTGDSILTAKWKRLAKGYPKLNPGNQETINSIKVDSCKNLKKLEKTSEIDDIVDELPEEPKQPGPEPADELLELEEEPKTAQEKVVEQLSKIALDESFKQKLLKHEQRIDELENQIKELIEWKTSL